MMNNAYPVSTPRSASHSIPLHLAATKIATAVVTSSSQDLPEGSRITKADMDGTLLGEVLLSAAPPSPTSTVRMNRLSSDMSNNAQLSPGEDGTLISEVQRNEIATAVVAASSQDFPQGSGITKADMDGTLLGEVLLSAAPPSPTSTVRMNRLSSDTSNNAQLSPGEDGTLISEVQRTKTLKIERTPTMLVAPPPTFPDVAQPPASVDSSDSPTLKLPNRNSRTEKTINRNQGASSSSVISNASMQADGKAKVPLSQPTYFFGETSGESTLVDTARVEEDPRSTS